jgi:hypothetical protein
VCPDRAKRGNIAAIVPRLHCPTWKNENVRRLHFAAIRNSGPAPSLARAATLARRLGGCWDVQVHFDRPRTAVSERGYFWTIRHSRCLYGGQLIRPYASHRTPVPPTADIRDGEEEEVAFSGLMALTGRAASISHFGEIAVRSTTRSGCNEWLVSGLATPVGSETRSTNDAPAMPSTA